MKGVVKWYNDVKGFGFIAPADDSKDVFVHRSDIRRNGRRMLVSGEEVEFEIGQSAKGRRAVNVIALSKSIYRDE